MKLLLLIGFIASIAKAQSEDLSWFNSGELTFEKQQSTNKAQGTEQPIIATATPKPAVTAQNRSTTIIESIKLIDAKTTEGLSPQLKKCRNVFMAVVKPSQNDSNSIGRDMKLSSTNSLAFKPSTLTIIFSTDPTCPREGDASALAPLLTELRQRATTGGRP